MTVDGSGAYCYYNLTGIASSPLQFNVTVNSTGGVADTENRVVYPLMCSVIDYGFSRWVMSKDMNCTGTGDHAIHFGSYSTLDGQGHILDSNGVYGESLTLAFWRAGNQYSYINLTNVTIWNGIYWISSDRDVFRDVTYYTAGHGGREYGCYFRHLKAYNSTFIGGFNFNGNQGEGDFYNVTVLDGNNNNPTWDYLGTDAYYSFYNSRIFANIGRTSGIYGSVGLYNTTMDCLGRDYCLSLGGNSGSGIQDSNFTNATMAFRSLFRYSSIIKNFINTTQMIGQSGDMLHIRNNRLSANTVQFAKGLSEIYDDGYPFAYQDGWTDPVLMRMWSASYMKNCNDITSGSPAQIYVDNGCNGGFNIMNVVTKTITYSGISDLMFPNVTNSTMEYLFMSYVYGGALVNNTNVSTYVNLSGNVYNITLLNVTAPVVNNVGPNVQYYRKWYVIYNATGSPSNVALTDVYGTVKFSGSGTSGISPQTEYYDNKGALTYYQPYTLRAAKSGYLSNSSTFNFSSDAIVRLSMDAPITLLSPTNGTMVDSNYVFVNVTAGGVPLSSCTLAYSFAGVGSYTQAMTVDGSYCYYNLSVAYSPIYYNVTVNTTTESGFSGNLVNYPFFCGVDDRGYSRFSLTHDYNCTSVIRLRSYTDFNGNGHWLDSSTAVLDLRALNYISHSEERGLKIYNVTIYNGFSQSGSEPFSVDSQFANMTLYTSGRGVNRDYIWTLGSPAANFYNVKVFGGFYTGDMSSVTLYQNTTFDSSKIPVIQSVGYFGVGSSYSLSTDAVITNRAFYSDASMNIQRTRITGDYMLPYCVQGGFIYRSVTVSYSNFSNCTTAVVSRGGYFTVDSNYFDTDYGVDYFDMNSGNGLTNNRFSARNILASGSSYDAGFFVPSSKPPVNNTQDGWVNPIVIRVYGSSGYYQNCSSVNASSVGAYPAQVLAFYGCNNLDVRGVTTRTVLSHRTNISVTGVTMDYFVGTGKWNVAGTRGIRLNNSNVTVMMNLTQVENAVLLNVTVPVIYDTTNASEYYRKWNAIYTVKGGAVPATVKIYDAFSNLVYSKSSTSSGITPQTEYLYNRSSVLYYQPYTVFVSDVPFGYYPNSTTFNFSSDAFVNIDLQSFQGFVASGQSIQNAINAASSGDTIGIYNGTYAENVIVNKSVTLICQNVSNTWISGGFNVTAANVNISNCNISGGYNASGIYDRAGIIASSTGGFFIGNHLRAITGVTRACASGGRSGVGAAFWLAGSSNNVSANIISDITGAFSDSVCGGEGSTAVDGGVGAAVYITGSSNYVSSNDIRNVTGGEGSHYRYRGGGAAGGAGTGFYFTNAATGNTVVSNTLSNVTGGNGGYGVVFTGTGSRTGGTGGVAAGIYFMPSASGNTVKKNVMTGVRGGYAGTGGLQVGGVVYGSYNQSGYGAYFEPSIEASTSEGGQNPTNNDLGLSSSDFNTVEGDYIIYLYNRNGLVVSGYSLTSLANPTNLGEIAVVNSVNVNVTGNTLRHSSGVAGFTQPSYNGGGFYGTHGFGIYLWNVTSSNVSANVISNVTGGSGASGGDYGLPSSGQDAMGIYLGGASSGNLLNLNQISSLTGGSLGYALMYTTRNSENGTSFGIYLASDSQNNDLGVGASTFNQRDGNYIVYLYGRNGISVSGLTLTAGGATTNYGKIALLSSSNMDVKGNTIADFAGETGYMTGNAGQTGSVGAGVYVSGGSGNNVSSNEIYNIYGGLGGPTNANAHGGTGGIGAAVYMTGSNTNFVGYNDIHDIYGGRGGIAWNDGFTYKGDGGVGAAVYLTSSTGNSLFWNTLGAVSGGTQGSFGVRAGANGIAYKLYPIPSTQLEPKTAGQMLNNGQTYYVNWTRADNHYGVYQLYWSTVQGAGENLIDSSITESGASCDADFTCTFAWTAGGLPTGTYIYTYLNESNNASVNSSYGAFTSSPPNQPTNEHPYNNSGSLAPINLRVTVTDPENDTMTVSFYNASGNSLIGTASSVPSGGVAQVTWSESFILFNNYSWYVNVTDSFYVTQSGVYNFMMDDPPMALDMHVSNRGIDHLVFAWNNAPDNDWVSLAVLEQTETLRTAVSSSDNWTANHELLKWNTVYNFTHYAGDVWGLIGPEYSFLVRTEGWLDDYITFPKKRLVTVTGLTAADLETYAVNVTLTDENFVFGNLGNPNNCTDVRFADYLEVSPLNYTLQYCNVTHAGGTEVQALPNYTACYGNWMDCNKTYDGDFNTFGSPFVGENASVYFNFTKPAMVKSSSKVTVKDGDGWGWQLDIPFACFSGGSALRFRALADYDARSVTWQCQQYSDNSWYTLRSVDNYYHVYHIEVLWAYQADAWFTVYLDHLDANYTPTFYMFYGKAGAPSESQSLSYAGVWQTTSIGSEITLTYPSAVIYNLTVEATGDTSFNATWFALPASDNWFRYSMNPFFIGEFSSGYDNSTTTPRLNVTGVLTNTTWYVRAMACASGQENPTCGYAESNVTLGILPSVPTVSILNYTEDRSNKQSMVCADLSDTDSQTVSLYVQYWEQDTENEFFNESSRVTGLVAPTVRCFSLPMAYGKTFMYRAVANGSVSTGFSDAYVNEFRAPETCFAGNPVTDDDDERERTCSGYREGSCQRETFIYIETNITDKGALNLKWWDGSSWSVIPMNSTPDMYYFQLNGLANNATWYTFEIWNSTSVLVNWTKPSRSHPENQPNQNERKYVSFGCTEQPLEYKVMYMRGFPRFDVPVYRWCIASGGGVYECMMAEYYGGGRESYLEADRTGTLYDAGELFRGGIWDGEAFDTGTLDPVRGEHSFDLNHIIINETLIHQGGQVPNFNVDSPDGTEEYRYCFAFLNFWWNESFIPSNGIRNYYAHYWHQDDWWSIYFWHEQPYNFDYDALFKWEFDYNSMTRDFRAQPETIQDVQNEVLHVSDIDLFNSSYPQSLSIYQKSFPEMVFDGDDSIYDFGFHLDATWTNVMMGKYQQAFVIFNVPDNTTLAGLDSDSDNLTDFVELYVYYTNPFSSDTDEGGFTDGQEVNHYHTNPNIYEDDDAISPTIDIYYPVNGTIYPIGNVTIFGVAHDAHLDSVVLNDSRFNNTGNSTDFNFVATGLGDGIYTVVMTANDTAMNVKTAEVWFKVDTSPPFIYDVQVQSVATPLEDSVALVSLNFSADDTTGVTGAVHYGGLRLGSEFASNSSCYHYNLSGTARRFVCMVPMQYYYAAGVWSAELQACDLGLLCNTSTIGSVTYNELKAWVSDTDTVSFGGYRLSDGPMFPDYVTLRNTGNVNNTNITLTAYSLVGVSEPSYTLPADGNVFKACHVANWATCTGLLNGDAVRIGDAYLDRRGVGTGMTTLYFGINPSALPAETGKQVYQNAFGQEWYLSS